jgi:hypothetical protein
MPFQTGKSSPILGTLSNSPANISNSYISETTIESIKMSVPYDNKPTTMHEEFAMDAIPRYPAGDSVAPYEPGGAEEKVRSLLTTFRWET